MTMPCAIHTDILLGGDPEECPACLAKRWLLSVSNDQVYFERVEEALADWIRDYQALNDLGHRQSLCDFLVIQLHERPIFLLLLLIESLTRSMCYVTSIPKCPICQVLHRDPQRVWDDEVHEPGSYKFEHQLCGACEEIARQATKADAKRGAA